MCGVIHAGGAKDAQRYGAPFFRQTLDSRLSLVQSSSDILFFFFLNGQLRGNEATWLVHKTFVSFAL